MAQIGESGVIADSRRPWFLVIRRIANRLQRAVLLPKAGEIAEK
jgi:hypothetical protein